MRLQRFAQLALDCVHREYPNQIALRMKSDADLRPPRELTPSFYGCYDWHSAVHGHWLLARVGRVEPEFAPTARAALANTLNQDALRREAEYVRERPGFERPYGLGWLLALHAETRQWNEPWSDWLEPLADVAVKHLSTWIPKLSHPNRTGTHSQTAFGFGLALDWARATGNSAFEALLVAHSQRLYGDDARYALHLEPSGEDFLSPSLGAADLMCRVLDADAFARYFERAFPNGVALSVAHVSDPTDGRIAHLDGLNLSRAWMLRRLAHALPNHAASLEPLADAHEESGLAAVSNAHYEGAHWLGTFAVYLLTLRFDEADPTAGARRA